ncbi:EVE domain-containing protein [Luteolibacter yonseiensis]|uniref:EVE domain-containing protein n=1 Tax=Luteolibacter yonseiensis TaxID=1144680 RepID=A0A934V8M6_9BACT|nr:EVE domain-containing protein [Luteolibacter yonseiensis]MBK1817417.1 EVE domain-containing protein [Luteolibacter yonseiensis]
MHHWLIKSEPDVFGIDHLAAVKREPWSGVRNYQARNYMWKDMKAGDLALFYHSNAKPPGVTGIARVVGEPYPDPTQFDEKSEYHDPKSTPENPRWWLRDFEFVKKFDEMLTLEALKADSLLSEMLVCQRGTRLSITPVEAVHYKRVCKLAGA